MKINEIKTKTDINYTLRIPGSKSVTHRALIASCLAEGISSLSGLLVCEDTVYTQDGLITIGFDIQRENGEAKIYGKAGDFPISKETKEIFLGNSGTSLRLLLSTAALCQGDFLFSGTDRMHQRPIGGLVNALNELGVEARCINAKDLPPVLLKGNGIKGGKVRIEGNKSSQYVSSILLAAPYAEKDVEIEILGNLVSKPYVDVTIKVMEEFGLKIEKKDSSNFFIKNAQTYTSRDFEIEGDVSTASYFWAAAAVTGGTVITENIYPFNTKQGDIHLLDIITEMGAKVEKNSDMVKVQGRDLRGIDIDMGDVPDMVPTVASMAIFANGKTKIRNVSHLHFKESDRLRAVAHEWNRIGCRVDELQDGLVIHGGGKTVSSEVDSHNDHRLAMSLAIAGLRIPGIKIKGAECVEKSFPRFWEYWERM
ncbi:3-phosphoshikimate 1-carboxyvinyltransferase [Thermodesulfobacteriota bacterium]